MCIMHQMHKKNTQYVVVGRGGQVEGVLSINDIVNALVGAEEDGSRYVGNGFFFVVLPMESPTC